MMVLPPGRLSITIDWPSRRASLSPIRRAKTSESPPGGYGTMMRIDLVGQFRAGEVCASAPPIAIVAAKANAARHVETLRIHALRYLLLSAPREGAIAVRRSLYLSPLAGRGRNERVLRTHS